MYKLVQLDTQGHHQTFVRRPRRREPTFVLRLTSMIDVFTILLVFLLKSYSAEGEIMSVSSGINLPVSTSAKHPETSSIIAITNDWVLIDGTPAERVETVLKSENLRIENLFKNLRAKRMMAERVSSLDDRMSFSGEITIQGDAEIPFELLKRVMFTCGQVGYNNILLAVTSTTE